MLPVRRDLDRRYKGSQESQFVSRAQSKPASQKDANRAHARLRAPGERASAQLKTRHILRKLRCCPRRAGQLAKAIHVLQAREPPMKKVHSIDKYELSCRGPAQMSTRYNAVRNSTGGILTTCLAKEPSVCGAMMKAGE